MSLDSQTLVETRWCEIERVFGGRERIDALARSTGALKRSRKIADGSQLLRLALAYAASMRSLRLAAGWGAPAVLGRPLSDVALMKRLQASGDFLAALMNELLQQLSGSAPAASWSGPPIRLVDGSLFSGPGREGGQHRLHASYDPVRQAFTTLEVSSIRKGESLDHAGIEAGEIAVADRNFAKTPQLRALSDKGAFYVVRAGLHAVRMLDPATGTRLTSAALIDALGDQQETQLNVVLEPSKPRRLDGQAGKSAPKNAPKPALLPARLIVSRASAAQQSRERARIERSKSRHGAQPTQETRDMSGIVLFLTNLPEHDWRSKE